MPLKSWNTKADFEAAYSTALKIPSENGSGIAVAYGGFTRATMMPHVRHRCDLIVDRMGWTAPGPVMVVLGDGLSLLTECFEDPGTHNFSRVVGVDTSTYLQSVKDQDEESEIDAILSAHGIDPASQRGQAAKQRHYTPGPRVRASRGNRNEDVFRPGNTNQARNAIRSALGLSGNQQPDVVLTDGMIPGFTDQEVLDGTAQLLNWVPQVVHYFIAATLGNNPGYNWKSVADWRTLIDGLGADASRVVLLSHEGVIG